MDPSGHLSEPSLRLAAPVLGAMDFTSLGTTIFVDTNRWRRGSHPSPTLVYNTENASLTLCPRVPDDVYHGCRLLQLKRIASDKRIELKTKFSFIFLMYSFVTSIE
jgi:hypothetical protein